MKRSWIIWIIIGLTAVSLSSCKTRQISRDEIYAFIGNYEKQLDYIDRRLAEEKWSYYTQGKADSLEIYQQAYDRLNADPARLSDIKTYQTLVDDPKIQRKLELISRRFMRGVVKADPAVAALADSLGHTVASWRHEFRGRSLTAGELRNAILTTSNRAERRQADVALSSPGEVLTDGLAALARMRNHVVSRLGYNSYYDLMLTADGLNKADFFDLLDRLEKLSADAYRSGLDSLKRTLGINVIDLTDIEYAVHQSEAAAAGYVPADRQMQMVTATMAALGTKLADMPIYFGDRDSSAVGTADPVLAIHVPQDIRVPVRLENGLPSLMRLFDQVGRAVYLARIEQEDVLLAGPPAPCFADGMADVFSGMTELDGWRLQYAGMPEPLVSRIRSAEEFSRLFRLRLMLVDLWFEKELYSNPASDLADVYGNLIQTYLLVPSGSVSPPVDVIADWITSPMHMQNELVGKCIQMQTYHYLHDKYQSVLDNQRTREFLVQNFFRFGASDDWQELLSRGTGEPLTPAYYLEYYGN
jgi:hypothetical protein